MSQVKKLILDEFAHRIFSAEKTKNYIEMTKEDFLDKVNSLYKSEAQLVAGYAPFCKHLFLLKRPNIKIIKL